MKSKELREEIDKVYKIYSILFDGEPDYGMTMTVERIILGAIAKNGNWMAHTMEGEKRGKMKKLWKIIKDFDWNKKTKEEDIKKIKGIRKKLVEEFKSELLKYEI